ncbi:hypothetical protein ACHAQH_009740, partial [Verticillium albo-atrum]
MSLIIHEVDLLIHSIEALLNTLNQVKCTQEALPDLAVAHASEVVASMRNSIEEFIRTIEAVPGRYDAGQESDLTK